MSHSFITADGCAGLRKTRGPSPSEPVGPDERVSGSQAAAARDAEGQRREK